MGPAPLLGPGAGVRVASAAPSRFRPTYPARPAPAAAQVAFTAAPLPAPARKLDILPSMPARSPAAPVGAYRIQAGAFSAEANARRAASQLAAVGPATVEPVQRDGTTLYRVMLIGPADELQAFGLRERVAAAGFEDALVVRPF
jgi:rare lipoprotein A